MVDLPDEGGIYTIRNSITNKAYVGSALSMFRRAREHCRSLRRGAHHSVKLQRAWDKYGSAAFSFSVLSRVEDPTTLVHNEQLWIDMLDTATYGYNMTATAGSLLGFKHTTETRRRMSQAQVGVSKSPEHVAAVTAALTGRKMTAEQCQKMSVAKLGKKRGPHSEETKAKMSAASMGRAKSPEHRVAMSAAKVGTTWTPARWAAFEARKSTIQSAA